MALTAATFIYSKNRISPFHSMVYHRSHDLCKPQRPEYFAGFAGAITLDLTVNCMERLYRRHLRVMHACEKGATGVYWGHRAVARLLYRDMVVHLDEMHGHEVKHYAIFGQLMRARGVRTVIAPVFWCVGGIVYGVLTGLAGRRAVWRSTAVIETIVERELEEAAQYFQGRDSEVHQAILEILAEEVAHKIAGSANSPGSAPVDDLVDSVARAGAITSKSLAERL
jgi:3-demethoxyubiquinol 3-hydroxylase